MKIVDEKYMQRCLDVAKNGLGTTWPNPIVGSVVVYKGKIIGEGYTSAYGGAHAEVNAIAEVTDHSLLKEATLYVSLEPCAHHGKTPPCVDLIIKHRIPRVVIGTKDPHDKVAGKGIAKLKKAGCEVNLGVLEDACKKHHKRFLNFHQKGRPYIVLKWAQTKDGFFAPDASKRSNAREPYWITGTTAKQKVHQWRSQEHAILVGTQTVLQDNPKLSVRTWAGKSPIRIILDRSLKIEGDFHVLDGRVKTYVITENKDVSKQHAHINYIFIDFSKPIAKQVVMALYKEQIISVLVEGGAQTLARFINENIWDEASVFTGNTTFSIGLRAPVIAKECSRTTMVSQDELSTYFND